MKYVLIVLMLVEGCLFAQSLPGSLAEQTQSRLERFQTLFPQEKVFLHMDKDAYLLGEKIWFKAYLVDASLHLPSELSSILYVELIGPADNVMASHPIRLENGKGKGDFAIDRKWLPGEYLIRAYTQYMRNYHPSLFFSQKIRVESPYLSFLEEETKEEVQTDQPSFSVQFFPEGGELVEGLVSIMGVTSRDLTGKGIALTGTIKDRQGKEISRFQTGRFGLGSFPFKPASGEKYSADITYQGKSINVKLPRALKQGYVIQVSRNNETDVSITLQTNHPDGLSGGVLLGHLRGQVFANLSSLRDKAMRFRLPLTNIPSGVVHFTLFSPEGLPVAERLTFIDNIAEEAQVSMQTDQQSYTGRQKVSLEVQIADSRGNPIEGSASLSVSERVFTDGPTASQNIRSYLLLASELRGPVEDPDYFFADESEDRKRLLDQLLMTHAWRRFVWTDLLVDKDPGIRFYNERGFTFSGTITRPDMEKKDLRAKVFLSSLDSENFFMDETITDENGRFVFTGYEFADTTDILLQANRYNPRKVGKKSKQKPGPDLGPDGNQNVDILLDRYGTPNTDPNWAFLPFLQVSDLLEQIQADPSWQAVLEKEYLQNKEYQLEEVVIEGRQKKKEDPYDRPGMLYGAPSQRIILDSLKAGSLSQTVFQIIRGRVPGVEIVGTPGINQTVRIRGSNSIMLNTTAMIMLDGVPIDAVSANTINIQNVEFIDVVKGLGQASVYGGMASGGIIAIYTRQGTQGTFGARIHRGVINIHHPGYYKAREFYAPTYQDQTTSQQASDFRTTLYWQPTVEVGVDGKATLEFYTADRASTYEIRLEGLTPSGIPLTAKLQFAVE